MVDTQADGTYGSKGVIKMGSEGTAFTYFIHRIDPVIFQVWSIKLYYYGLAYAIGFLGVYLWFQWRKDELGWHNEEVYDFSLLFTASVLIFGRAFEIVVYEWEYYKEHLSQLLSFWRGGMASHGVLLGGVVGIWAFSRLRKKSFIQLLDEVAIPGAFFLALGRIGNFINGQIFGSVTDVWWAVKFPDAEGFRHPVALYESMKNFLIVLILLFVRKKSPSGHGRLVAHFVLWYGLLRVFTDYFREYGTEYLGIGTGQYFNFFMAALGLGLLIWYSRKNYARLAVNRSPSSGEAPGKTKRCVSGTILGMKRAVLVAILLFSLSIPSSWTQGVLKEYRDRKSIKHVAAKSLPVQKHRDSIRSFIPDRILNQGRPRVPLIGL